MFEEAIAPSSWTLPAMASIFSSLHPGQHGTVSRGDAFSKKDAGLMKQFHAAGYRTAKFVSNPIIGPEFGFSQGTELFHMLPSELIPKTKLGWRLSGYARFVLTGRRRRQRRRRYCLAIGRASQTVLG